MPNSPIRIKSELELLREQNIKERDAFIASLLKDNPEFADVMETMSSLSKNSVNKKPKIRKRTNSEDTTFKFHGLIPLEKRRSARLQNKEPLYTEADLIDSEITYKRKRVSDSDYTNLEDIIYEPKKSRSISKRAVHHVIPVEQISQGMIENIARKVSEKRYSDAGTSCHQCRQKTTDQKTCCRNADCVGVRGQFCGVCLENRYGEDAAVALRDPNWHCPVCRGICNCSFCRAKAGKRPTGILTPLAHQAGHKSVKDFLESLKGEGDYANQDNLWHQNQDPDLLGFSSDLNTAHMSDGIQHKFNITLDIESMEKVYQKEEKKCKLVKENYDYDHPNLLGFFKNSDIALMEDGIQYEMKPPISTEKFQKLSEHVQRK